MKSTSRRKNPWRTFFTAFGFLRDFREFTAIQTPPRVFLRKSAETIVHEVLNLDKPESNKVLSSHEDAVPVGQTSSLRLQKQFYLPSNAEGVKDHSLGWSEAEPQERNRNSPFKR